MIALRGRRCARLRAGARVLRCAIVALLLPAGGAVPQEEVASPQEVRETLARGLEQRHRLPGTIAGTVRLKRFLSEAYRESERERSLDALDMMDGPESERERRLEALDLSGPMPELDDRSLTTVRFRCSVPPAVWAAELLQLPAGGADWWGFGRFDGNGAPVDPRDRRLVSWSDHIQRLDYDATVPSAVRSEPGREPPEYLAGILGALVYTADDVLIRYVRDETTRVYGGYMLDGYETYKVEHSWRTPRNRGYRRAWISPDLSFGVLRHELCWVPADYPSRAAKLFIRKYSGYRQSEAGTLLPTSFQQQVFMSFADGEVSWWDTSTMETNGLVVEPEDSWPPWREWALPLGTPISDMATGGGQYEGGLSPQFIEDFMAEAPPPLEDAAKLFAELLESDN